MRNMIIRGQWSHPIALEDAFWDDRTNAQGLYYITRCWNNRETKSLYLGIARYNNTIRKRLKAHYINWLPEKRGQIQVRIGQIIYPYGLNEDEMATVIYDAESALLYDEKHKDLFPENIDKRKSYHYTNLYRVENQGDIFELSPSVRMHDQE